MIKMRKLLATSIAGIIFGVIIAGAGVAGNFDAQAIKFGISNGYISIGMESNASFLAPIPINYSITPAMPCKNDYAIRTETQFGIECSEDIISHEN